MKVGRQVSSDLRFIPVSSGLTPNNKQLASVGSVFVLIYQVNNYLGLTKTTQRMGKGGLLGFMFFGLTACETAIEVDVPRSPAQLTVNALFNPDSVWQVELTENRYILDNEPFAAVPDAEVRIQQEGQTVAVLDYLGNAPFTGTSIYRATNAYPTSDAAYTLRVSHPDYGDLVASSQVPSAPQIVEVTLDTLDVRQEGQFVNDQIAYGFTLRLKDPPTENFYSLSLIIRFEEFGTIAINGNNKLLIKEDNDLLVRIQSDDPVVMRIKS